VSVAGIFSNSSNLFNYGAQSFQSRAPQDFTQLGQDLQSGNLSAAQQDFAALGQFAPPSSSTSASNAPASGKDPLADDFSQLGQDLQSGNTSSAQQDFAKIQQDFQAREQAQQQAAPTPRHVHHHPSQSSDASQTLAQLGQSLQSGDLTSAQQAYLSLQQEFQQFDENNLSLLNAAVGGLSLAA
jgi:hypothetical protein